MSQVASPIAHGLTEAFDALPRAEKKRKVAALSIVASALISFAKMVVGLLSGSLALIADATQGMLDIAIGCLTYHGVTSSEKGSDPRNTYGRHKVEALTAIAECGILLVIGLFFWLAGLHKLLFGGREVNIEFWYIIVVAIVIATDFGRFLFLQRAARATRSLALSVNSFHFLVDSIASVVVLASLFLVWAGIAQADAMATIIVAMFIGFTALRIGRRAADVLLDRADPTLSWKLVERASAVKGVQKLRVLRVRDAGPVGFAEVVVEVSPRLSLKQADRIRREVEERVAAEIGEAEIVVSTVIAQDIAGAE
ncbi:MAG: cation diffusion facilitator family transporter [Rhizobiaceae bacterium]